MFELWKRPCDFDRTALFSLCLLCAVGFCLRLYNLDYPSLWFDELFSVMVSDPENTLVRVYRVTLSDVHPPVYQILLHYWFKLTVYSDFSGRILSVFFGTLQIIAIYYLGGEVKSKALGYVAAILMATNYFCIYYSQELRSYTLLCLLTTLSLYFYLRLLKDFMQIADSAQSKKHYLVNLVLFVLISSVLVNTHYFGFLVLFSQIVFVCAFSVVTKSLSKKMLYSFLVSGLVIFLASYHLLPQIQQRDNSEFWISKVPTLFFVDYFKLEILSWFSLALILFGLIKQVLKKECFVIIFLLFFLIFPVLISYLYSISRTPLITERNTIIIMPLLILLISWGLVSLKAKLSVVGVIVFSGLSMFSLLQDDFYFRDKQDWKGITNHLVKKAPSVNIYSLRWEKYFNYYFYQHDSSLRSYPFNDISEEGKPDAFWLLGGFLDDNQDYWPSDKLVGYKEVERYSGMNVLGIKFQRVN